MRNFLQGVFIIFVTGILFGCGKNPILGKWEIVTAGEPLNPLTCRTINFLKDREICDSFTIEIEYEVLDQMVIVSAKEQSLLLSGGIAISIINNNLIYYRDPTSGKKIYYQRNESAEVTPEAIEYSMKYSVSELEKSCKAAPVKVEHESKYWSEIAPKKIKADICRALQIKLASSG
ncbi:hypothetical protein Maes01_02814 [Microbulbifer aestuariivivens]|uniref:Lipoprotein n=1 Tax=Microbulbifer aestuariivivens TaxID=1908308 RepID=A0ABP9WSY7_9GAMM